MIGKNSVVLEFKWSMKMLKKLCRLHTMTQSTIHWIYQRKKHNKAYNLYSICATLKKFIAKCCFTYKERVLFSCEASKWVVSRSSKLLQLLVSRSSPPLPTASRTTFSRSHPFKSYPVNYHRYRYMLTYSIKSFHSISYGWFPEGVFRIQIRIGSVWDSSGAGLGVRIRIGLQIEGGKIPPSSHI